MVLLPLLTLLVGQAAAPEPCCDIQTVKDRGALDGIYIINPSPTAPIEEVCLNSCVYTKYEGPKHEEYCFKGTSVPGFAECSAMPTEQPVTGSTEAPSAEGLKNEKAAMEVEMAKDEQEMAALQEQETAAAAVDAEIDKVQDKIDQLTGDSSGRVRRQAATTCTVIGQLVEEMGKVKDTKKKLVIIRRITASVIVSCTGEDDKQFLVIQKVKLKQTITQIKNENGETMKEIRKTKWSLKMKIVTNKKKIQKILAKLEIIENPKTTVPIVPTTSKVPPKPTQGPTQGSPEPSTVELIPTEETPKPMTPEPTLKPHTTRSPIGYTSTGNPNPTKETPKPITPEPTLKPHATTIPTGWTSTGETPKPMTPQPTLKPHTTRIPTGNPNPTEETPKPMTPEPTLKPHDTTIPTGWSSTGETPKPMTPEPTLKPHTTRSPTGYTSMTPEPTLKPHATTSPTGWSSTGETPKPMTTEPTAKPLTTPTGWSSNGETPKSMILTVNTATTVVTPPGWASDGETPRIMPTGLKL